MAEKKNLVKNRTATTGRGQSRGGQSASRAKSAKTGQNRKTAVPKQDMQNDEKISIGEEITLWLILALSVLILISNFGGGGFLGNAVSRFFMGTFGILAYLFPLALFLGVAFAISNRGKRIMWVKMSGFLLLFLSLTIFSELINGFHKNKTLIEYYRYSMEEHTGGGIVGGAFCKLLCPAIGIAGAYVVVIVLVIVSMILITERSFFRGVQKGSERVYVSAKADARRRMEQARLRREEQALYREQQLLREQEEFLHRREAFEEEKQRRMDHKVSGVTFQTDLMPSSAAAPLPQAETEILQDIQVEDPLPDTFSEPKFDFMDSFSIEGLEEPEETVLEEEIVSELPQKEEISDGTYQTPQTKTPALENADTGETMPVEKAEKNKKNPRSSASEQKAQLESVSEEIEAAEKMQKPEYIFPPLEMLGLPKKNKNGNSSELLKNTAQKLQNTLHSFGVEAHVTNVSCGPSVTRYELTPEQGVKVSRIVNLADDIKLNLAAEDIRIEAPIPGKAAVGIEVPNKESSGVYLRELLESREFQEASSHLSIAVGKDLAGKIVVADIAKMPHLLIAGATGSGKSVCVNTIIMSLIYKSSPEDVKLIMIDPKVVELSVYNGIPHLFIPVVTDPKKAAGALNWAVTEMTERYQKFAMFGVRDLKGYNKKLEEIPQEQRTSEMKKLPQIVIIVDELADLMMVAPGEVEDAVCRLAQLARAAGLHLILATQRPSVNVITGLIKANMPSRIAFKASSGVDSRTILDMNGAEKLLGKGDMLFYPQNYQKPARLQGAFVTDKEVEKVVEFLTDQNTAETYNAEMQEQLSKVTQAAQDLKNGGSDVDEYFADAGKFIIEKDKASIGMLQRMFKIGFNRAARIMDQLSDAGVVGPEEGTKPRKVLMSKEQFENYLEQGQ